MLTAPAPAETCSTCSRNGRPKLSRLTIFRFNAEGSSKLPSDLSLPPAPSLVLFSRGAICYQFIGEVSRGELDEMLARARVLGLAREPEAPGDRRPAVGPPRSENVTP